VPGGGGYGIGINHSSADNLIENNISWNFNKVMLMRASGGGNVIAYNYMEDGYIEYAKGYPEEGLNASHMTTPHHELFEGNLSWNMGGESRWGNSVYITFFRNHVTTLRGNYVGGLTDGVARRAVGLEEGHYWYNFVGNVLGYSGMSPSPYSAFTYEDEYPYSESAAPMWRLGKPNSIGINANTDPKVAETILRDGNFDYATNELRWHGIGGPPSTTPPSASTLPDSLYLTEKPAFFEDNPWPWVDPAGSTKVYTLPAKARFDAIHAP
jgi:hypothetical protein